MAHHYRAQVSITMDTGTPADACVNVFHFDADADITLDESVRLDHITDRLTAFYQTIDGVLFPAEVGTTAGLKIYDLADPEPRAPKRDTTIALTPAVTGAMPSEVAICLSYQAARESGVNHARRRGRVYLGPLHIGVLQTSAGGSRPSTTARTSIATAATALAASTQVNRPVWAVFSPTRRAEGGSLDDSFTDVEDGWVDDAFDIQRRRGLAPTARTLWT